MQVTIAGGGIAGLATAIALHLRGHEVQLFEQAPALTEVGAGLQISANGWKVLDALGVTDTVLPKVFEPPTIEMRMGRSGRRVWSLPMGKISRKVWGAPYMHVHRADLVEALAARLRSLAPDALHTGRQVSGFTHGTDRVRGMLSDGEAFETDLLIGADGVHSVVREEMLGPERADYTGMIAWRCVVPVARLGPDAPPANATVWAGAGRHCVTTRLRGGDLVNFVGIVETPEPVEENWQATGTRGQAQADFEDWAPPISAILEQAETLHRWALFTRLPLPRWSDGAVVVLGDAAHPMLPSMAQGAVQALEDAWVLAALTQEHKARDLGPAFYAARIARVSRVQKGSARNAAMFHRAGPFVTPIYYGGMALVTRMAPSLLVQRQGWVYEHDVVAQRPLN